MSQVIDFKAAAAQIAKENNIDQTKATAGGGDFAPPKAGPCLLRFVGYAELGKHAGTYQGKPTNKPYVQLAFEVHGPNHPPIEFEGKKRAQLVVIEETYSLSENARFLPLAKRLLYKGDQQHVVGCLGDAYKGRIIHRKYAKRGEDKTKPETWTGVAVELFDKEAKQWTVEPPRRPIIDEATDMETGEYKVIAVPEVLGDVRGFLWDASGPMLKAMWDSLFIDGTYPERKNEKGEVIAPAKSKNSIQNKIKTATNFIGSPIHTLLLENGTPIDIPDAEQGDEALAGEPGGEVKAPPPMTIADVPTGAEADDALNGIA